jgi:hypothetical protein
MLNQAQTKLGDFWCRLTHDSPMWPLHGHYECRTCGRRYPAFTETLKRIAPLTLAVALSALAPAAHAADGLKGHAPLEARAAFERYTGAGPSTPWAAESIEIHASLPKLAQAGGLRAIRRLETSGESRYQVLQLTGDRTVKDQVIVRYLHAEERAAEIPAASIAVTPANYSFTYKGALDDGEYLVYIFQIRPRRKGQGLIRGELWLDQHTGAPVREYGSLVKSPSIFVRRVTVTQENELRDGAIASRLTHITVDTRLAGRAELAIEERPLVPAQVALSIEGGRQ